MYFYRQCPFRDGSLLIISDTISRILLPVMDVNEPSNVTLHVTRCSPVAQWETCIFIIHQKRPSGSAHLTHAGGATGGEREEESGGGRERETEKKTRGSALECTGGKEGKPVRKKGGETHKVRKTLRHCYRDGLY